MAGKNQKFFFLGKGGAGKTTISALTAFSLAHDNKKVALISLDPAHNLFDAFNISSKKSSKVISHNLHLEEIDLNHWIKKYLKSIQENVSQSYKYLTSLGLDKHLEIIKYSPGMEEYALIYAYQSLIKRYKDFDYLIFDMPPTGLALRFFNLPGLSLVWLEKLVQIRKQILEKKNIIETVKTGNEKSFHDKVLDQLLRMQKENRILENYFKDYNQASVFVVLNNDKLSFAESKDILTKLLSLEVNIRQFILNKTEGSTKEIKFIEEEGIPTSVLPQFSQPLLGIEMFEKYCRLPEFMRYLDELNI